MSENLCPYCRRTDHGPEACPEAPHRKSQAEQEEAVRSLDVQGFWRLVGRLARKVGFVRQAVAGALAYFVMPLDLVPDFLPIVGFGDDASVVLGTWALVRCHVTDEHHFQADRRLGLPSTCQRA